MAGVSTADAEVDARLRARVIKPWFRSLVIIGRGRWGRDLVLVVALSGFVVVDVDTKGRKTPFEALERDLVSQCEVTVKPPPRFLPAAPVADFPPLSARCSPSASPAPSASEGALEVVADVDKPRPGMESRSAARESLTRRWRGVSGAL